ncbi:efflux transporter outer membrane subunit, partial [Burkholderia cenocepacia]
MADRLLPALLGRAALMAGCELAPTYRAPDVPVPAALRETGPWIDAAPADRLPRDERFEPVERRVAVHAPPTVARHDEAAALFDDAPAALLPTVGIVAETDRDRPSARPPLRGSGQPDLYESHTLPAGTGHDVHPWATAPH